MANDMMFKGANVAGTDDVEFMRYRTADEDVNFSKKYIHQSR